MTSLQGFQIRKVDSFQELMGFDEFIVNTILCAVIAKPLLGVPLQSLLDEVICRFGKLDLEVDLAFGDVLIRQHPGGPSKRRVPVEKLVDYNAKAPNIDHGGRTVSV